MPDNADIRDVLADLDATPNPQFDSFSNDDAVELGLLAVELIKQRGLNLAVDITVGEDLVFRAKLGSTGPGNDPWLAGKAATAREYGVPSLLVRLRFEEEGVDFVEREVEGVTLRAAGGAIPLMVGDAVVGTLTMSGEPDVVDHATAAEAIELYARGRA
ncbi:heme-binding protein [Microbacterium allomyrinae]|uniref:Heme-binding protein n=1 Tax=Microbacterium allomyrinae TaxID=2830666 RepID=A0A9X1LU42_9MICO|nr:heme-binding protein [Microbacterium allomyrinae]MCC2031550.1 heme-binding protein [Microbacterium allomyrinae]